jgi:multidrug efflux system membrane fusion protein
MKLNTSYIIAGVAFLAIFVWFLVNNINAPEAPVGKTQAEFQAENLQIVPTVRVQSVSAQQHENVLELYGQTESHREVTVKAQTAGLVVSVPVAEGTTVRTGALVCRQDVDARQAMVDKG